MADDAGADADAAAGAVTVYGGGSSAVVDHTNSSNNLLSRKIAKGKMLRGGVIVVVTDVYQAKIAESAGARCVVVSEPNRGGVIRMPDPALVKEIQSAISIAVVARARVGHFVEAQILESVRVDYIDESEAIALADEDHFINKHNFHTPFICGCVDLGVALRRLREGAAMIRIQGDLNGLGSISETVGNVRKLMGEIRMLNNMDDDEVFTFAKKIAAPYDIVAQTKQVGRLPVAQFAAGGITTPADAALMMQLGCDGVMLESDIFTTSADPLKKIYAIVQAVRNYNDANVLADVSTGLEDATGRISL